MGVYTADEREYIGRVADGLEWFSTSMRVRRAAEDRAFLVEQCRIMARVVQRLAENIEAGS